MKHHSVYLDWYVNQKNLTYDLRSSGITTYPYTGTNNTFDLGTNYHKGNPTTLKLLAQRYHTQPENIFLSSEGTSGQNSRIIRLLAETKPKKNHAIIEYPTYEPLLRLLQNHYPIIHQVQRTESENYRFDLRTLKKKVSKKTGLLVITNPHAPSGAYLTKDELQEILALAQTYDFYVLCDEIYAEFNRSLHPTLYSMNTKHAIVTTSFTKAYGLGGLKLGITLANTSLVQLLYNDMLNTVGNSSNLVEHIAAELFTHHIKNLEQHKQHWQQLKKETEHWLDEHSLSYHPNQTSITYWIKTPIPDTYTWTNNHTIPTIRLAVVPGTFFLFKKDYKLQKTNMIRLGLGNIKPQTSQLTNALTHLAQALKKHNK